MRWVDPNSSLVCTNLEKTPTSIVPLACGQSSSKCLFTHIIEKIINFKFLYQQWPINHKVYVCYRILIAICLTVWLFADLLYENQVFYRERTWIYLIYATNWSFILLVSTSIFQAICVLVYSIRHSCCLGKNVISGL